jgi:hypothetical protein
MVGAIAVTFLLGLAAFSLGSTSRAAESAWGLRHWLLLGAGGLAVTALGWAAFIPADPYYTPTIFGVSNRVNGLAGFGLVLVIYAAVGVIGVLVERLTTPDRGIAALTTLMLTILLGSAYIHVLERHSRLWRTAYDRELVGARRLQATYPTLPRGTTVFTSNYPANETLGVPIFGTNWGLNGMIKLKYDDESLRAYPITEERGLECLAAGIGIGGDEGIEPAEYGTVRFLDLQSGRHATPKTRRDCLAEKSRFPPGPLYLATAY